MGAITEIRVPDIGDFKDVPIIEVLVAPGDVISAEDSLIALESEKATMEVPSPQAGTVRELKAKVGDKVSEGSPILTLEVSEEKPAKVEKPEPKKPEPEKPKVATEAAPRAKPTPAAITEIRVPDIGDFKDVPIIEVLVAPGDVIKVEDSLIALESEKATMEVPSPQAGTVRELKAKVGDKVSEGSPILTLEVGEEKPAKAAQEKPAPEKPKVAEAAPSPKPESKPAPVPQRKAPPHPAVHETRFSHAHAGPSVRRLGRELGVDLGKVEGSGPKGRIVKEDVQSFVKSALAKPAGFAVPQIPEFDFSKFGPTEEKPLSRIRKLSATNLHRNWLAIPHVTQHDEADITGLEEFRQTMAREQGVKFTLLSFLVKASQAGLKEFPDFNSSLNAAGDALTLKRYFHIGFAVDTDEGLIVPVIRDVDRKGVLQIAKELAEMSERARAKKLGPSDMQGGCFSISSLGGIGGTHFTPIINAPEVAILGVSRSYQKPILENGSWAPKLTLPLSLSYDHRVIDGAQAARFTRFLSGVLADVRRLLL